MTNMLTASTSYRNFHVTDKNKITPSRKQKQTQSIHPLAWLCGAGEVGYTLDRSPIIKHLNYLSDTNWQIILIIRLKTQSNYSKVEMFMLIPNKHD